MLLQAPTGAGKTRMATELARKLPEPVMMISERREIVAQTMAAFRKAGLKAITLTADTQTARSQIYDYAPRYIVGSQRTVWSRFARRKHKIRDMGTVIVDEAHHALASTYEEVLALWPKAKRPVADGDACARGRPGHGLGCGLHGAGQRLRRAQHATR